MPPKSKSKQAKKPRLGAPPTGEKKQPIGQVEAKRPTKTVPGKKPVYEWMPFTKKSVDFTAAAAKLARYIKNVYGEGVSITQYQKFLLHYAQASDEEKSHLWVDVKGVNLARAYETAKVARDDERNAFRGDVPVADVQGTLETLASKFQGPIGPPSGDREDDEEMDGGEEDEAEY